MRDTTSTSTYYLYAAFRFPFIYILQQQQCIPATGMLPGAPGTRVPGTRYLQQQYKRTNTILAVWLFLYPKDPRFYFSRFSRYFNDLLPFHLPAYSAARPISLVSTINIITATTVLLLVLLLLLLLLLVLLCDTPEAHHSHHTISQQQ